MRVEPADLPKTVRRFFDEWKDQQALIRKLSQVLIDNLKTIVTKETVSINGRSIFISRLDLPHELLIEVLRRINAANIEGVLASTVYGKTMLVSNIRDRALLEALMATVSKYGGRCRDLKNGVMCTSEIDATTLLTKIREIIRKSSK